MKLNRVFVAPALAGLVITMAISASGPTATVERFGKEIDQLVPADLHMEKMATGYTWTEGPVWIHAGFLMYAEIPSNSIYKLKPGSSPELFLRPSGWTESTPFGGKEPGSNGMTLDAHGRLTVAGHARRNVYRLETLDPKGKVTVLADRYEGKRFNSPNDLVYKKDGSLYFTDPPYGLATQSDDDSKKELKFNGVFRLANASNHAAGAPPANKDLSLMVSDITRPNGLAFSPDEKYLYVNSSDVTKKIWMRYEVMPNGTLTKGQLIYDATSDPRIGGPDGMKVDTLGNLYSTGPGGIWIFSPALKHIGTIIVPERTGNLAWGDDGKSLYITASSSIYRVKLKVPGIRP